MRTPVFGDPITCWLQRLPGHHRRTEAKFSLLISEQSLGVGWGTAESAPKPTF
jgi:hypothetical protein